MSWCVGHTEGGRKGVTTEVMGVHNFILGRGGGKVSKINLVILIRLEAILCLKKLKCFRRGKKLL